MDLGGEARQAGQEAIIVDAELASAMPAGALGRRHLDRDQAGAAAARAPRSRRCEASVTRPSASAVRVVIDGMTMRFLISTVPMRAGWKDAHISTPATIPMLATIVMRRCMPHGSLPMASQTRDRPWWGGTGRGVATSD